MYSLLLLAIALGETIDVCKNFSIGHEESLKNIYDNGVLSSEWKGMWNSKRQQESDKEFIFQYIQPVDIGLSITNISVNTAETSLSLKFTSRNELTSIANSTVITVTNDCPPTLNGLFMITLSLEFSHPQCNISGISWLKVCGLGMPIPRKGLFVSTQKSKSSGIIVEDGINTQ